MGRSTRAAGVRTSRYHACPRSREFVHKSPCWSIARQPSASARPRRSRFRTCNAFQCVYTRLPAPLSPQRARLPIAQRTQRLQCDVAACEWCMYTALRGAGAQARHFKRQLSCAAAAHTRPSRRSATQHPGTVLSPPRCRPPDAPVAARKWTRTSRMASGGSSRGPTPPQNVAMCAVALQTAY